MKGSKGIGNKDAQTRAILDPIEFLYHCPLCNKDFMTSSTYHLVTPINPRRCSHVGDIELLYREKLGLLGDRREEFEGTHEGF
jgi:hypothetical protein